MYQILGQVAPLPRPEAAGPRVAPAETVKINTKPLRLAYQPRGQLK